MKNLITEIANELESIAKRDGFHNWQKPSASALFYHKAARRVLDNLASKGLGFYEADPNFWSNNKFIPLLDILEE